MATDVDFCDDVEYAKSVDINLSTRISSVFLNFCLQIKFSNLISYECKKRNCVNLNMHKSDKLKDRTKLVQHVK